MTNKVKVGGVWKDAAPFAKVAGNWRNVLKGWQKDAGIWKLILFTDRGVTGNSQQIYRYISSGTSKYYRTYLQTTSPQFISPSTGSSIAYILPNSNNGADTTEWQKSHIAGVRLKAEDTRSDEYELAVTFYFTSLNPSLTDASIVLFIIPGVSTYSWTVGQLKSAGFTVSDVGTTTYKPAGGSAAGQEITLRYITIERTAVPAAWSGELYNLVYGLIQPKQVSETKNSSVMLTYYPD
ncbi:hypothetical protein [Photobacterium halotolerans]|uniref:hypothetical protein n=1 Tax=Photobacterium halotolerans TaxID=265726 RepID=UPI0004861AB8|nr:hypothetical protein [Photobacterium halotolerans]